MKILTHLLISFVCLVLPLSAFASGGGSSSSAPVETPIQKYKKSWEQIALKHQNGIDKYAPMSKANFVMTHNTYNSKAYQSVTAYIDPNQILSIYDQLDIGVRTIELDTHWTFQTDGWPWEWGYELILCHGQDNHVGCGPNDKDFSEGLAEVRNFLNANPKEVLMIYIEDHTSGHQNDVVSQMNSYFGAKIYTSPGCQSIPMSLRKADILSAGKQVIIVGGDCSHGSTWTDFTYNGHFSTTQDNVTAYPQCQAGSYDAAAIQNNLVRIYEDSTNMSAWFGNPGPRITAESAARMVKCGIGAIGLDQLNLWDTRLKAQIWSWGDGEPNNYNNEDCAEQRSDGRFNDNNCSVSRHFACKNLSTGEWRITNASGSWTSGASACVNEFGSGYPFSVPYNGYENAKLSELRSSRGYSSIWINYSDIASEGTWAPGN